MSLGRAIMMRRGCTYAPWGAARGPRARGAYVHPVLGGAARGLVLGLLFGAVLVLAPRVGSGLQRGALAVAQVIYTLLGREDGARPFAVIHPALVSTAEERLHSRLVQMGAC